MNLVWDRMKSAPASLVHTIPCIFLTTIDGAVPQISKLIHICLLLLDHLYQPSLLVSNNIPLEHPPPKKKHKQTQTSQKVLFAPLLYASWCKTNADVNVNQIFLLLLFKFTMNTSLKWETPPTHTHTLLPFALEVVGVHTTLSAIKVKL